MFCFSEKAIFGSNTWSSYRCLRKIRGYNMGHYKDRSRWCGVSTRLYFGTRVTKDNLLYQGVAKLSKLKPTRNKFGDRIHATFKEPKFTLTLSNLSFNDSVTLTLVVNQENGATLIPRTVSLKSVKILEVRGAHFH